MSPDGSGPDDDRRERAGENGQNGRDDAVDADRTDERDGAPGGRDETGAADDPPGRTGGDDRRTRSERDRTTGGVGGRRSASRRPPDRSPRSDRDGGGPSRPRLTIAKRELAAIKSEKTIVLALAIQLFVAAFSSFLVVGLVSMYDPSGADAERIAVGVAGDQRDELAAVASWQDDVDATTYASESGARTAYDQRAIDAVVIANERADGRIRVDATVPDGGVESTLTVTALQDALLEYERYVRDQRSAALDREPLDLPDVPEPQPYYSFTYTVLVPLLVLLPVFISGSVAVDAITEELERGTFELLAVAPVEVGEIVDGKLLAAAGLAPAQAALWLVLLSVNDTPVENVPALLAVVGALALAVVAMGMALALVTAERRQAQFLYSVGVLAIALATAALPEHPVNTIAKLAIGSPAETTWLAVAGYAVIGVLALVLVKVAVDRLDVQRIVTN